MALRNNAFDIVIVGAGPAGLSCAIHLAKNGMKPIVLERGPYPGAKNMSGGVVYGRILVNIIPDFMDSAPIERYVTKRVITVLSDRDALSFEYSNEEYLLPPYNGFTVLRPAFDRWLGQEAERAGVTILNGVTVTDARVEKDSVVLSVNNGEGVLSARILIAADGVNSILARKTGLRKEFKDTETAVGVKETLYLHSGEIEKRFRLDRNEGLANEFIGLSTQGVVSGGFLYTNSDSISVGIVAKISSLKEKKVSPVELFESFKGHRLIRPMIKGAKAAEYSAHLIPEGGYKSLSKLYGKRVLLCGDAAGFVLNTGLSLEGANYAIASGISAAKTVVEVFPNDDFSDKALSGYTRYLTEMGVLTDFKLFENAAETINNPRLHREYPDLINKVARSVFSINGKAKEKPGRLFYRETRKLIGLKQLIRDGIQAARGLFL